MLRFRPAIGLVLLLLSAAVVGVLGNQHNPDHKSFNAAPSNPSLLSTLEAQLSLEHARYQLAQHQRLLSLPKHPEHFADMRSRMALFFSSLHPPSPADEPLHLSNINELRLAGYRFPAHIDPGLHAPFGTHWDFSKFGPFPSTRLAQGGFKEGVERGKVEVELQNAREALDWQVSLEVGAGRKQYRRLMAYTDDLELLRSAIEYHARRLEEGVKRVAGGVKAMRFG